MKVLICSDSHGRLDYFQQVMDLESPEIVIFAGDHSTDAIDMSLVYRDVLFAIVKGNTDMDDYETRETKILEKKAHLEKAEICVFGHTHKEFLTEKNGIVFINPGALQDKKYAIYYGGKKFEQKILK